MTTLSPSYSAPPPAAASAAATPLAKPAALALVVWAFGALIVAGGVMSAGLVASSRIDWMRGFLAASVVSLAATVMGLVPLLVSLRGSALQILGGWVLGSMIRAGVSLGGCFCSAYLLKTPAAPTFLLMVVYYFAVLIAETRIMAVSLKQYEKPAPTGASASQPHTVHL